METDYIRNKLIEVQEKCGYFTILEIFSDDSILYKELKSMDVHDYTRIYSSSEQIGTDQILFKKEGITNIRSIYLPTKEGIDYLGERFDVIILRGVRLNSMSELLYFLHICKVNSMSNGVVILIIDDSNFDEDKLIASIGKHNFNVSSIEKSIDKNKIYITLIKKERKRSTCKQKKT